MKALSRRMIAEKSPYHLFAGAAVPLKGIKIGR